MVALIGYVSRKFGQNDYLFAYSCGTQLEVTLNYIFFPILTLILGKQTSQSTLRDIYHASEFK